ncbi:MAG: hypothetical protein ABH842_00435 [Candidatus Micrarchaeota archaeon]
MYDKKTDLRYVPNAVPRVEEIISNIDHPDVEIRREYSTGAIYALMGGISSDATHRLLDKLAERLKLSSKGIPTEQDVYVREHCANAFEMAGATGKDAFSHVSVLTQSRESDPHEWVRERARDALSYFREQKSRLPRPGQFTKNRASGLPTNEKRLQSTV